MNVKTRHVRYAFADVVGFTNDRTVEAQSEIVAALNDAFRSATKDLETIFLPTGDGICAGIIQSDAPADSHLTVALQVVREIYGWSAEAESNRKCEVRFGINESVDSLITDINRNTNIAGAGINEAQRVMGLADGKSNRCRTRGIRDTSSPR